MTIDGEHCDNADATIDGNSNIDYDFRLRRSQLHPALDIWHVKRRQNTSLTVMGCWWCQYVVRN